MQGLFHHPNVNIQLIQHSNNSCFSDKNTAKTTHVAYFTIRCIAFMVKILFGECQTESHNTPTRRGGLGNQTI